MRLRRPRPVIVALAAVVALAALLIVPRAWTRVSYDDRVFPGAAAAPAEPSRRVAIVFGAGLSRSGNPSPVLYDRVATAVDLYRQGKAGKLLMTGDNRFKNYNEPEAMRELAVGMGVPEADVVLDYAGRRTYDSCYRAREIFGVTRAYFVTQAFHLDRALYLGESLGIDAIGVAADRRDYGRVPRTSWFLREFVATAGAIVDICILRPTPVLGEKMPIE